MADLKIQQLEAILPVSTNVWVGQNDLFIVKMKARGTAPFDEDRKLTWAQLVSSLQLGQYMPTVGGIFTGNVTLNNNISLMGKQTGSGSAVSMVKMDTNNNINIGSSSNNLVLSSPIPPKYDDGQAQWDVITTKNLPTPGQLSGGAAYTKAEVDSKDNLKLDKTGGTVTGNITFDKDKYLVGTTSAGAAAYLTRLLTSNNTVYFGDQSLQTRVVSSAVPLWDNGSNTYQFYTENNKPTSEDVGTYTKAQIDSKDALKLDKAGGDVTGNINLANNVSLSGKTTSGTNRALAYVDTGNMSRFGDVAANTRIDSAIVPVWGTSAATYKFYTEFNKPTTTELGIESRLQKADTAMQPGAFGLGGIPTHRSDASFLTTTDKTEFFIQDGSANEQRFGGLGAGVHAYYGTTGTGNATQYLSTSLFTRADGNVISKFSTLDYQGNLVNTLTNQLYGTLNKPSAADVGAYSKSEGDARYARQGINSDITALNGLTGALKVGANATNPLEVTTLQQVQAMTSGTAGAVVGVVGGYIGAVMWFNGTDRSKIPAGWVSADGQKLNIVDYPDLWAAVNSGALPGQDEALWLESGDANRPYAHRAKYSRGDLTTWFRTPDLNGVQLNSIKHLFLSGSSSASQEPLIHQVWAQSSPNIQGGVSSMNTGVFSPGTDGALSTSNSMPNYAAAASGASSNTYFRFNANAYNKTYGRGAAYQDHLGGVAQSPDKVIGDLYPNHAPGIWIIRASSNFEASKTEFAIYNGVSSEPAANYTAHGGVLRSLFTVGGVNRNVALFYANKDTWSDQYTSANIDVAQYDASGVVQSNATFKFLSNGSYSASGGIYSQTIEAFGSQAPNRRIEARPGGANGWYSGNASLSYMVLYPDNVSNSGMYVRSKDSNIQSYTHLFTANSVKSKYVWDFSGTSGLFASNTPSSSYNTLWSLAPFRVIASDAVAGSSQYQPLCAISGGTSSGIGYYGGVGFGKFTSGGQAFGYPAIIRGLTDSDSNGNFTNTSWWLFGNDATGGGISTVAGVITPNGSDCRAKENINDANPQTALDNINRLKFKSFSWKEDPDSKIIRGFIAQEVADIDEAYVTKSQGAINGEVIEDFHSLNNNMLLADALAAIQVLSRKIDELENQLAAK